MIFLDIIPEKLRYIRNLFLKSCDIFIKTLFPIRTLSSRICSYQQTLFLINKRIRFEFNGIRATKGSIKNKVFYVLCFFLKERPLFPAHFGLVANTPMVLSARNCASVGGDGSFSFETVNNCNFITSAAISC